MMQVNSNSRENGFLEIESSNEISWKGKVKTETVTSKDGTLIIYRRMGSGPGLVILHGTMESGRSHMELAEALADSFTVYLPDRREHSLSYPFAKDYDIEKEIEDVRALLTKTGSNFIFGVSSGAIISLRAARSLQNITRVAVYEPPLSIERSRVVDALRKVDNEMSRGDVAGVLITAMKGAEMGPLIMRIMPDKILEYFFNRQTKKQGEGNTFMWEMAKNLHYNFEIVVETAGNFNDYERMNAEVLLLGGSKSPSYLRHGVKMLEKVLPQSRRVEFLGLDHGGSSDPSPYNKHGNPRIVAQELRRFFAQDSRHLSLR
jgi:pimeloyl-ACP methyl ester carboxylesterase